VRSQSPNELLPLETVWTLALNNQLTAPPAYDRSRAYFPIEGHRLVAYDLLTGRQSWLVDAEPLFEPATGEDLVFLAEAHRLSARRAADGSVAWQLPFDEPLAVGLVWDNGWLIAATAKGVVIAFRGSDGQRIWQRDLGAAAHGHPALAADRVYIPTAENRVVALQVATGTTVWERRLGGPANEMLAFDERLYVGSTDGFFYCVMAKDGRIDWRWRTGGNIIGVPAADNRLVFFVSLDNVLRALDRTSGGQPWMKTLPIRPTAGPVLSGGTLVVGGLNPTLRTFNAKDGKPANDIPAGGEILAAPPHALLHPGTGLPMLLIVTRDLVKGASAILSVHSVEPASTQVAPLPNTITLPLTLPSR
jgi:outer membrane protein assembly factor BamB